MLELRHWVGGGSRGVLLRGEAVFKQRLDQHILVVEKKHDWGVVLEDLVDQ